MLLGGEGVRAGGCGFNSLGVIFFSSSFSFFFLLTHTFISKIIYQKVAIGFV